MTDNDIIEAYKNCQTKSGSGCHNCPFDKGEDCSCLDDLREATFNLIYRQKAEIERLKQENEFCHKTITENAQRALEVTVEEIETAKSEAIKEFCEKRGIKYVEDDV